MEARFAIEARLKNSAIATHLGGREGVQSEARGCGAAWAEDRTETEEL